MNFMTTEQRCLNCSILITPTMAGHPGSLTIPWHENPEAPGKPCPASQSPANASAFPVLALKSPAPARVWLKAPSPDENILLWMNLVEKQTGKPFILEGDAYCIVEEIGEGAEASSLEEYEDALCDTYVATLVGEELLRRSWQDRPQKILPEGEKRSCLENLAVFAGRLAEYCRKPKTEERAQATFDSSLTAKLAIKRELSRLGLQFESSVEKVLNVLDKRLQDGYQMNAAGSAIKKQDQ